MRSLNQTQQQEQQPKQQPAQASTAADGVKRKALPEHFEGTRFLVVNPSLRDAPPSRRQCLQHAKDQRRYAHIYRSRDDIAGFFDSMLAARHMVRLARTATN